MSDMYAIKSSTLTAIGDAVRSKVNGTAELPVPISKENVEGRPYKLEVIEFPDFVKTVKVVGHVYDVDISDLNPQGILHNLAYVPSVYTSDSDIRDDANFAVVNPNWDGIGYDFEITVKSNALTFTTEKGYNSWQRTFVYDYTAIGLDENGNEFKYTPLQMAEKIDGLMTVPDEALNLTNSLSYRFKSDGWNWFIERYGNKITTEDITALLSTFDENSIEEIPFELNCKTGLDIHLQGTFTNCVNLKKLPKINNISVYNLKDTFSGCNRVRNIPEDYCDTWTFDSLHNYTSGNIGYTFQNMYSIRKIATRLLNERYSKSTSSAMSPYYRGFNNCFALDDIVGLAIQPAKLTSNVFNTTFDNCNRLSEIIFNTNEDGTTKTAEWKSQTIDLSSYIGYANLSTYILNYNSGITADKQVKDDTTYQALKDDPDWFTTDINYSRYNHDSAVNTINSLPDCSATGTNTIKFKGQAGALTDGGAINTLTEAEIAVAAAKGWSVALV